MKLKEKVAIVTGGAAGIGEASCRLFAREGAQIACLDRDGQGAERVSNEIRRAGYTAESFACDVSIEEEVETAVQQILKRFGRIDILFNNAGIVTGGKIHEVTTAAWDSCFAVNVRSMFLFCHAVIPVFLKQGAGVILSTSSCTALRSVPNRTTYSATKSAVLSMTRSMAIDYAAANIRVNCLCPGTVDTPSLHERLGDSPEMWKKFVERQPLGRVGQAEEIANAALYLVSDEAAYVTGTAFQIDGGMSL